MDKIKKEIEKMSLKKALLMLAVICLSLVSVLSVITTLAFSNIRQQILDTRPIIVNGYTIDSTNNYDAEMNGGLTVVPHEYSHGKLSKENQIYYWCATIFMVVLPVFYIIIAAILVAKLYYKLKLQIPLENLKNGMNHISEQDLDFQIQYSSNDELGKLCDTFEQMKNEIYRSSCEMWEMLQERKALTASISHDLRTPITVINGYLDYLEKSVEKGNLTSEVLLSTIHNMIGASNRLERYVDCVKDIQKMEDIEIRKEIHDFKSLIDEVTRAFSILAKQQNKVFELQNYSQAEHINTDKDMLSKILENIFDNALRFSVEQITLTINETEEELSFTVRDDGIGFFPEEFNSATSFFYSSTVKGGNFGIGLSICKILCEKLGGALLLENNSDHGASVTIKIRK